MSFTDGIIAENGRIFHRFKEKVKNSKVFIKLSLFLAGESVKFDSSCYGHLNTYWNSHMNDDRMSRGAAGGNGGSFLFMDHR